MPARQRRNAAASNRVFNCTASHRDDEQVHCSLLSRAKRELVLMLVDCARLFIRNKHRLTEPLPFHLQQNTDDIYDLVNPRTSIAQRRQILQMRGFLGAILRPALGLLILLVRGLIKKDNCRSTYKFTRWRKLSSYAMTCLSQKLFFLKCVESL